MLFLDGILQRKFALLHVICCLSSTRSTFHAFLARIPVSRVYASLDPQPFSLHHSSRWKKRGINLISAAHPSRSFTLCTIQLVGPFVFANDVNSLSLPRCRKKLHFSRLHIVHRPYNHDLFLPNQTIQNLTVHL